MERRKYSVAGVIKLPKDKRAETRFVRKVGRYGNSLGVGLPKALADKLRIAQGDEVEFIENDRGEVVLKKARKGNLPEGVRPEVLQVFYDVFEEDRGILEDLRNR
jgi:antitoxin MazE